MSDELDRRIPSLLDRLISYHERVPGRLNKNPPGPPATLREICLLVVKDLQILLATKAHSPNSPVYQYPLVARSVVNYGVADFTGQSLDMSMEQRLRSAIIRAVEAFEPRVVQGTLNVSVWLEGGTEGGSGTGRGVSEDSKSAAESEPNSLVIEVSAHVCPLPLPEPILFRTVLHADGGVTSEQESASG